MADLSYTFKDVERVKTYAMARSIVDRMLDDPEYQKKMKDTDAANDVVVIAETLQDRFMEFYDEIQRGLSEYDKRETLHGREKKYQRRYLTDAEKTEFPAIFVALANALYNANGTPKNPPEKPSHTILADLNESLNASPLYNTEITFGVFTMMLNYSDKLRDIFKYGIDFTRSTPNTSITSRIEEAVSDKRSLRPELKLGEFIDPPPCKEEERENETYVTLGGLHFAAHRVNDPDRAGRTYFVLQNGQLVDSTQELRDKIEEHVKARKPLSELKIPHSGNNSLADYIDPAIQPEASRGVTTLARDAIHALHTAEPSPPVCLEQDKLTGLRMDKDREESSPLDALKKFITECGYKNGFVDMLGDADKHPQGVQAHIEQIMDGLSQKAQQKEAAGDRYPSLLIDRTKDRLSLMLEKAWDASSKAFENKSGGIESPQAFFPLGVSGSGKSRVKKIADAKTNKNIVVASLDDGRIEAGNEYWLSIGTENHNYDYKDFGEFGELVRGLVVQRAIRDKYNLFWDGSGIPWKGKNEAAAKRLKQEGYDVTVLKTSTPLFTKNLSGDGLQLDDNVTTRLGHRGVIERRFVPNDVFLRKAKMEITSANDAENDPNKKDFGIVDTANLDRKAYYLQFDIQGTRDTINKLRECDGNAEKTKKYLTENGYLTEKMEWNNAKYANFCVARELEGGRFKIKIITDTEHYVRDQMKGLMCLHDLDKRGRPPKGPESMLAHTLNFDVSGFFQNKDGWLIVPQGEKEPETWPPYVRIASRQKMTQQSLAQTRASAVDTGQSPA